MKQEIKHKGACYMGTPVGQTTLGNLMPIFIVIAILVLVVVFCIRMAIKTSKAKKANKAAQTNDLKSKNADMMITITHFYGLPVHEGAPTKVYWSTDKVIFEANGASFNLDMSKITDVSLKTNVEIQKQYVSSAGGAVAGGMMFGPIGAMIGGRAKEKQSKEITRYIIFTYADANEMKYIALSYGDYFPLTNQVQKFVDAFKNITPNTPQSFNL